MPKYLLEISPEKGVVVSILEEDGKHYVLSEEAVRNLIHYLIRILGIMAGSLIFSPGFGVVHSSVDGIIVETSHDVGYGTHIRLDPADKNT